MSNKKKDEDTLEELVLKLLIDPNDEYFLNILNKFNQNKQLPKFHKLLFSQQIEVQKNLDKKRDQIEQLKKEWRSENDDQIDEKGSIESEIKHQLLYSTLSTYGKQIANLPFSQKLDLWKIFLEQDLELNQLCLQLFSIFLLHFDVTSNKITPLFQSSLIDLINQTNQLFSEKVDLKLLNLSYNLIRWLELIYSWGQFLFIHQIYSKNKSTKIISETADNSEFDCDKYDLHLLHSYKDATFWIDFIKQSLQKEEKNLEITELTIKLIIQNLLFINSSAISSFKIDLNKFNKKVGSIIVEQIHKYPNLVFYLNVEQFYEIMTDKHLTIMLNDLIVKYIENKEPKYLTFLSQDYFKNSRRVQILMIKVFINILNSICSKNEIQNSNFLNLLELVEKKQWSLDSFSIILTSKYDDSIDKTDFSNDLTELLSNLDNLEPVKNFEDNQVQNLFNLLEQCVSVDDLLVCNQFLLSIIFIGFLSAYRTTDSQLSISSLNFLIKIFKTNQPFYLFNVYLASSLFKRLFIILMPFNVNSILNFISLVVKKAMVKWTYFKDYSDAKEILEFLNKFDDKEIKSKSIKELHFVIRTIFLIQMHGSLDRKKRGKSRYYFVNDNEAKEILSTNIEQCLKQFDYRLNDDSYNKFFKIYCINGVLRFFNLKNSDMDNEFKKYFDSSIKLIFEGVWESTNPFEKSVIYNYLDFILEKKTNSFSLKISKLGLIEQIWTLFIFKPLKVESFNENIDEHQLDDYEKFCEQLENSKVAIPSKRKTNNDQNDEKSTELDIDLNTDLLLELTRITLQHCSLQQFYRFLKHLICALKKFNSEFLTDLIDFNQLKKKLNLFILIKMLFQKIKIFASNDKNKLNLLRSEFIDEIIVQVVNFAQNIYNLKIEIQTNLKKEEHNEDIQITINKQEEELKDKMNQICQIQILILETVGTILEPFRTLGNFTSQQVNYFVHVCVLTDLNSYQNDSMMMVRFPNVFNGIYLILNQILINYKFTVTSAFSAYMKLINNLLENLCKISFQIRYLNLKPETQQEIERCSINFQHLLLLLSKTKEYNDCTTNLLITIINQMQNDTIYSKIKNRILIGIYKLLNSSKLDSQFIYSKLNQEGRQMFKQIYDNYEKFYRFKGYV